MTAEARAAEPRQAPQPHDETSLSAADDRIRQSSWLPCPGRDPAHPVG